MECFPWHLMSFPFSASVHIFNDCLHVGNNLLRIKLNLYFLEGLSLLQLPLYVMNICKIKSGYKKLKNEQEFKIQFRYQNLEKNADT